MSLRRFAFPLRLVGARLRAGGERALLIALGVAAGAAVLAAVLGGRLVMQDRSLALATAQLQPADRQVQVTWSGAVDSFPRLNDEVVPQLRQVTGAEPAAAMLFRESSIQGRLVNLRAADGLGRYVRLISGRLPATCVPAHCEVLRLEGAGPIPSTPALHLIVVGRAALKPEAPIAPFVLPAPPTVMIAQAVRYHTPQPSPVVIADGIAGLSRTTELETFYRSYAWFVPVRSGDIHPWSVGAFSARVQRISAQLEASPDEFEVTAPTETLTAAKASSTAASRRLLLLGGEGAALLLAFTVLAASALRRDVGDARRRLVWFGATRWQVELFTLAEAAALAVTGTIVGWVLGGAVAALVADRAGSPAGQVVVHSLLSRDGLLAAAAVAAIAGLLLYATVRAPGIQFGRLAFTPLDAAALGAIAIVLIGWARGSIDAPALASSTGTSAFLLLVPALIVFATAVLAARLLAPALRAVGRLGRRGPISVRLAAASLARNPGHAAIAATFLVASVGLALFALVYRSTLVQGQHDESSYAVPSSFVLTEDLAQLIPVLHGAPASAYPAAPTRVLRLTGNVPSGATFTMLGLPTPGLAAVGGWRHDFAALSLGELGRKLVPPSTMSLRTLALPPGRVFTLPVTVRGDDIGVIAIFRSSLDDYQPVSLGHSNGNKLVVLRGRIPFRHGTLAQLQFTLTANNLHGSANGGIGIQPSAKGVATFGTPRVNGIPVRGALHGFVGTAALSGTASTRRLPDHAGPARRPSPCPADRRTPDPGAGDAGRRRGSRPARDHPAAGGGRAGCCPRRRCDPPFSVDRRRRRDRRPADDVDAVRYPVARPRHDRRALAGRAAGAGSGNRCPPRPGPVHRADDHLTRGDVANARGGSTRARCVADARGHRGGRLAARAGRPAARHRLRRARRPRRALRPRGAGSRTVDDPRPPPDPSAARRRIRDRRRSRARGDPLGTRAGARLGDRRRRRAGATASPGARLGTARDRGRRLRVARRAARRRGDESARTRTVSCSRGGGMNAPAIELRDVFRVHSTPEGDAAALQGLSLRVADGEVLTVLGPSGSGKSTLLRILAGLDRPSAGIVRVYGEDVGKLPARQLARYRSSLLGYADQHYTRALSPELTARQLVALQLGLRGADRSERLRRADELLERVGLAGKRNRLPAQLSGGEQQRIALCAALAHRPRVFLADEPTGELDAATADQVYGALAELVREHRCTTVIVSHDPESTRIADRIVRIRDGRVSEEWARDGAESDTIVVGRGGWLRLPEELLLRAGIGTHATARLGTGSVVVEAAEGSSIEGPVPGTEVPGTAPEPEPARRVAAAVHGLQKRFGDTVVFDGLSAELRGGLLHAVTGPSGSGKTTLLHLLAGLELPDDGSIEVDGVQLTSLDRAGRAALRRARIAYVGQQVGLIPHLSALENVELALAVRGLEDRPAALAALDSVGLTDRATQRVARLSQGERARTAIARALASRPALLLADEPTSRLDGANAVAVAVLLGRLAHTSGAAVVCATHDPLVIEQADQSVALTSSS